jgi:hypothetical protein
MTIGARTDGSRRVTVPGASALLVALALLAGASALEGQARLTTTVDTTRVTVGDRVTLTVRVEHEADAAVLWPDSIDLDPFEVLDAWGRAPTTEEGRTVSSADFSLAAFELGMLEIPSFEIEVLHTDGTRETLETDRFGIEVVSVGSDEGGDIREIRGPLAIPLSPLRVTVLALLLMALGALIWAAYRRWRNARMPSKPAALGPPPRPPHEVAFEALDRLEASALLPRGEVKQYHIEASDILRHFVEAFFDIPALEMTTWEIMAGLEGVEAPGKARNRLRRLLDQCDLVKFAKVRPDTDASRGIVPLGREVIELSLGWSPPATAKPPTNASSSEALPEGEPLAAVGEPD